MVPIKWPAWVFAAALFGGLAGKAEAQGYPVAVAPPAVPAPEVPPPPPVPPQGQWVNTPEYGLVWIPAGAQSYAIGGMPHAYLYTQSYGWSWYASPWGWGPYAPAVVVHRPWPFGFRVWVHGPRGWGWHVGPRVYVRPAPAPVYVVPHHHHAHGWQRPYRYGGVHRGYRRWR